MCGICGIWGAGDPQPVRAMMRASVHRGPDDQGLYRDERIAMGHTRLAILDLTDAAHQPMAGANGAVWLSYNGEVYNYRSERVRLEARGHTFRSGSDTEVVLHAYLEYGDDFLTRLRGMFALAIYDRRRGPGRERLVLARDPLGIKPLIYAGDARTLVFASELKTLLASGRVPSRVDADALAEVLAFGSVSQPATIVAGVRMLPPGHRLILEADRVRIEPYWELDTRRHPELAALPYDEQVRRLREVLEESVCLHMVADVPVGAFLSGGIDSAAVTALMARRSTHRVRTFSVGFEAEGRTIDETDEAARAAQFIGTEHHRVLVTGADVRARILDIARALDQPSVDGINSYFVSAAAAGGVKVAMSGTGGDELFAGYPWYAEMMRAQQRSLDGGPVARIARIGSRLASHPLAQRLPGRTTGRVLERARACGDLLTRYTRLYQIYGAHRAQELLCGDLTRALSHPPSARARAAASDELAHASIIARVSALTLRGYTLNQLLRDIDAVSMAQSLEVRVPLLDPVVTDFALALPDSSKLREPGASDAGISYRQSGAKRILIDAVRDVLPPDIDTRPKRGFAMPFAAWLKGPLRDVLEDTLCERSVAARGLFDSAAVARVSRDFDAGRASWPFPWLLMMTELWCREVLDTAAPVPQVA